MTMLAALSGVFGETAAGVTVGALRAAADEGALGPDDRVVVLVTGTGLKTPQIVETRAGVEIGADVDELLEHIGVTA
jgi:threonine synthase